MRKDPNTIAPPGATRARFRGRLFLAQHGPDHAIRGLTVCVDYAMACLALAGAADGDIWLVAPDQGGPLRKYLAGAAAPLRCPMARHPENIIVEVSRAADVSRSTALLAVEAALRDRGGVGWALYAARERIRGGPQNNAN